MITELQYNEFESKLRFTQGKILNYLDRVNAFNRVDFPQLVDFYSGNAFSISDTPFKNLKSLLQEAEDISLRTRERQFALTNYLFWEINDFLEDIRVNLFAVLKTGKFLKSSKTNFNFSGEIENDFSLQSKETLEEMVRLRMKSEDFQNEWSEVALRNDLSEVDYDLEGGQIIRVKLRLIDENSDIKVVVDNMVGQNLLGKDIDRKITFEDNDLKVLSFSDCVRQSVEILAGLLKGDIPEFPELGRNENIATTQNNFGFNTTLRDLTYVFSSDDTLTGFVVRNLSFIGSDINLEFYVTDKLSNENQITLTI